MPYINDHPIYNETSSCNIILFLFFLIQVQAEALRLELKEKQNLLCEAATALELMEQSQKSREDACQSTIEELNTKIQFLEVKIFVVNVFIINLDGLIVDIFF